MAIPPSEARRQRGNAAEDLAAEYLKVRGLQVLARNVCFRCGELDLVCLDGDVLVVVEVRQRGRTDFGGALASVTWRKQRKIIRATRCVLRIKAEWRDYRVRFDVIGMQGPPDGGHQFVWIKDAFRAA
jgi:putative endonuclease